MTFQHAARCLFLVPLWLLSLSMPVVAAELDAGLPEPLWRELVQMASRNQALQGNLQVVVREVGRKPLSVNAPVAMRQGVLRLDLDLTALAATGEAPELTVLTTMGVRQATILLFSKPRAAWLLVPRLKAACSLTVAGTVATVLADQSRGRERVEGRDCVVRHLTVREGNVVSVLQLWEAVALQRLPVRGELRSPTLRVSFLVAQIVPGTLAPASFAVPANFRVCATPEEMLLNGLFGE